ncbi:MAG: protein-L-isoaspartate(D-aspartate) O-methyltransferase [Elusimicrobiota bacterium]
MKDNNDAAAEMVRTQLLPRGISDNTVLDAFLKVPRSLFVPERFSREAYDDHPLPIGEGQTISQPFMAAIMTELLKIKKGDKILEIGTGSGYQTAILAELGGEVNTVEKIEPLSQKARNTLDGIGYKNINYRIGDGTAGWAEKAPFDKIIVTAAAREIPPLFIEQLAEGGRLVIPVGETFSQELTIVEKEKGKIIKKFYGGCVFVPLVGEYST